MAMHSIFCGVCQTYHGFDQDKCPMEEMERLKQAHLGDLVLIDEMVQEAKRLREALTRCAELLSDGADWQDDMGWHKAAEIDRNAANTARAVLRGDKSEQVKG